MTVTVIGHLCLDLIRSADGAETESHGGIFFSLAALANLLDARDTLCPVFGVGKNDYEALMERLKQYPNIDCTGIYKFNGPTNQVFLNYQDAARRVECSKNIAEPIPIKKIRPYLDTNMVLVNMISGSDITLETMDELRMHIRDEHIPIYMDVHSLTLGVNEDFTRYHRPLPNWRRWLFMIHAAQMNEEEAAALTPEKYDEPTFAKQTMVLNTNALFITKGARGFTAYWDEHKHLHHVDVEGLDVNAVDATGCGDVFAAAYCAHYCRSKDNLAAAEFANKAASVKATFAGSREIDKLSSLRLSRTQPTEGSS